MKGFITACAMAMSVPFGWMQRHIPWTPPQQQIHWQKHPPQVGDLSINWGGITTDAPIYTINNFMPGDIETRTITIFNNSKETQVVGIRAIKVKEDLAPALIMRITSGNQEIYKNKLSQFFLDSNNPGNTGVKLASIPTHQNRQFTFDVLFPDGVDNNNYQNKKTIFDLTIGVYWDIPAECQGMKFDNIIYGTDKSENLTGGRGNNLIIGMGGDDKIEGNNGNDCLVGGDGNDKIHGNNGDDVLIGGGGKNTLDGGNGRDVCKDGTIKKSCEI